MRPVILYLWDLKKCRFDLIPQSIILDRRVSSLSCGDVIVNRGRLLKGVANFFLRYFRSSNKYSSSNFFFYMPFIRIRSFLDKYKLFGRDLTSNESIVEFFSIHFLPISSQLPNCHLSCSINRMENLTC